MSEFAQVETTLVKEGESLREGKAGFRAWPGAVTLIYVYCCAACGKTLSVCMQYNGTPMWEPGTPEDWTKLWGEYGIQTYYCGDHDIEVKTIVDGEVVRRS